MRRIVRVFVLRLAARERTDERTNENNERTVTRRVVSKVFAVQDARSPFFAKALAKSAGKNSHFFPYNVSHLTDGTRGRALCCCFFILRRTRVLSNFINNSSRSTNKKKQFSSYMKLRFRVCLPYEGKELKSGGGRGESRNEEIRRSLLETESTDDGSFDGSFARS